MFRRIRLIAVLTLLLCFIASGCSNGNNTTSNQNSKNTALAGSESPTPTLQPVSPIDVSKVKPNEAGKIMVVMFHRFVESFTPTKGDNGEYTTTFSDFKSLLQELYDKDYRLISMKDFLDNNISIPAGKIPMVFTFDDGTSGQFNLVENSGKLEVNPNSAVGIMEEFNKEHPDFGLKGVFYVNLGAKTFEGAGTVTERLKYLIDKGFEIGNHTYDHIYLPNAKSADQVQMEVGKNYNEMQVMFKGYKMETLALPFGAASKELQKYVAKGSYEGIPYENKALMEVGANPTVPSINMTFNPLKTPRVRATGIKPVECDLQWWLKNISRKEQYVSDGDPNTITVPKSEESTIDTSRLNGKKLSTY